MVLFRRPDGATAAFDDRCPHRAAPLSMGRLEGDRLVCGYHGLEFGMDGMCARNPHPSGKIPPKARVRTYPIVERHRAAWIWLGEAPADTALIPDFSVLDTSANITRLDHMIMAAGYGLIVDNLLDCSHTSFLHEGVLGNRAMIAAPTELKQEGTRIHVTRWARDVPPPAMFDMLYRQDGGNVDCWTDFRWDPPSCLLLDVGVTTPDHPKGEGTGYFGVHILTPETERTTHYHFAASRWNVRPGTESEEMRTTISEMRRFAFERQDEPMITAQQRNLDMSLPGSLGRVVLETDLGVVAWRKIMARLIAAEANGATRPRLAESDLSA